MVEIVIQTTDPSLAGKITDRQGIQHAENCNKTGNFFVTEASRPRQVACMKSGSLNSMSPSNVAHLDISGRDNATYVTAEIDTDANFPVFKVDMLQRLNWSYLK